MRFILYSFLYIIFAFQCYSLRGPGQANAVRGSPFGWRPRQLFRARQMHNRALSLQRMGSRVNNNAAMFKRMSRGRKKRDVYETFEKVPGRD